jgi:hypothetical protein
MFRKTIQDIHVRKGAGMKYETLGVLPKEFPLDVCDFRLGNFGLPSLFSQFSLKISSFCNTY